MEPGASERKYLRGSEGNPLLNPGDMNGIGVEQKGNRI